MHAFKGIARLHLRFALELGTGLIDKGKKAEKKLLVGQESTMTTDST